MLVWNVIPARVVLYETVAVIGHISTGGIVAAVIDPHIPPVCLIVDIVNEVFRNSDGPELQYIHTAQFPVTTDTGIELKAIQILREVD